MKELSLKIIQGSIRTYQRTISPDHGVFRAFFMARGAQCRFTPTCSEYFSEAISARGILKGTLLTMKRIVRCRPGGGLGYDPAPKEK